MLEVEKNYKHLILIFVYKLQVWKFADLKYVYNWDY